MFAVRVLMWEQVDSNYQPMQVTRFTVLRLFQLSDTPKIQNTIIYVLYQLSYIRFPFWVDSNHWPHIMLLFVFFVDTSEPRTQDYRLQIYRDCQLHQWPIITEVFLFIYPLIFMFVFCCMTSYSFVCFNFSRIATT